MIKQKGKLFGIGVGPGDSELLTLKAVKILEKIPVICSPKSSPKKESIALSIVKPILEKRDKKESTKRLEKKEKNEKNGNSYKSSLEIVEPVFPMTEEQKTLEKHWDDASNLIAEYLDEGLDVGFITLGDPSIYSTFSYVQKRLENRYEIELVPGINSFTACASSIEKPLVEKDEILMVIPKIDDRLESLLEEGNTFVLMKTSRNTEELEQIIHEQNCEKEITSVQNCTMENESIIDGFPKNKPYLTTTIVKLKK